MAYLSQTDLENALGTAIVLAIFDDNQDGIPDQGPIAACLDYASTECDSYLRGHYDVTFPISPVPSELKFAAVDFACAYAARRRPDIVRAMNEQPWTVFIEAANAKMKRYTAVLQRLPPSVGPPVTTGGAVYVGDTTPDDGTPQSRWKDMGDF